jgi:hypothetical protein
MKKTVKKRISEPTEYMAENLKNQNLRLMTNSKLDSEDLAKTRRDQEASQRENLVVVLATKNRTVVKSSHGPVTNKHHQERKQPRIKSKQDQENAKRKDKKELLK